MLNGDDVVDIAQRGIGHLGQNGKLVLELGPGQGTFAIAHAKANPQSFHVLIEIDQRNCGIIERKARAQKLRNVGLVRGDARSSLAKLDSGLVFDTVHCHFPSPYNRVGTFNPKIFGPETCSELRRLTDTGTEVFIVSDKHFVVRSMQSNLGRSFRVAPWIAPLTPLFGGSVIGTEVERLYCFDRGIAAHHVRLVRV